MGNTRVRIIMVALVAIVVVASACARHNDFPPLLPIQEPPVPQNFTVTTPDDQLYDLSWSVDNPSLVAFYQIYTLNLFTGLPEPVDTTTTTAVQINVGTPFPGLTFGVSSITTENVESSAVFAQAE